MTEVAQKTDEILEGLLNRISPVGTRQRKLKVMVYSEPGAGKSVFMGTAPKNLVLDVEDGLSSLSNHPDMVKDSVAELPYKSFFQAEELIKRLQDDVPQLAQFETFSVDSMSELHKRGLAEVVEREWKKNPLAVNRYVAETEHHTENNEHIRRLVSSLRDLDRNIIITAHARTVQQKNGSIKVYPDFSEKLANTLAGIVDIVGYMEKREIEGKVVRVMRLHSNGLVTAKSRIGGFPAEIQNPTWDILWDGFQKHLAKEAESK